MTDTELIVAQAKKIAELELISSYQRDQISELENTLRSHENITESNDDVPLSMGGLKNKCDMTTA